MQHEEAPLESLATDAPAPRPRVVALLNQKGGVGKTTSTVNLGAALARHGHRVLLVDLDPQSNLSLHFGVEGSPEQRTVRDLLLDPSCGIEDVVQQARPGLDFVPAVTELALVEGELAAMDGMQEVLRGKLEAARGRYDVVLLDCPPSLGVLSVNALTAADEVFVPMQAHYLPLRGLEKLLQTVHLVAQGLNPSIRVTGILLCMHDGSSSHARAVIGEMEAQFEQFRAADVPWSGACVLQPPIRRNIKLAEAPSFGKTIFDYAPACPGARDYRELARGLLERWGLSADAFDGGPARRARTTRRASPSPKSSSPPKSRRSHTPSPKPKLKPRSKPSSKPKPKPKPSPKPKGRPARPPEPTRTSKSRTAAPASKAKARAPRPVARPARAPKAKRDTRAGRGRIRSGGLSL